MTGSFTSEGPKMSLSRLLAITARSLLSARSPGHRRHDRDLVLVANLRLEAGTEPDVLVVQVHVHELSELALVVEKAILEARVARVERLDRSLQVVGAHLDSDLAVREPAQRSGNSEMSHRQICTISRNDFI